MVTKENRKNVRVNSVNLLNYVYFSDDQVKESQGMGRTLNLSEGGILLETPSCLKENLEVSLNIGLKEEILCVSGKVIYANADDNGLCKSGIHFVDIGSDEFKLLKNHLQESLA